MMKDLHGWYVLALKVCPENRAILEELEDSEKLLKGLKSSLAECKQQIKEVCEKGVSSEKLQSLENYTTCIAHQFFGSYSKFLENAVTHIFDTIKNSRVNTSTINDDIKKMIDQQRSFPFSDNLMGKIEELKHIINYN